MLRGQREPGLDIVSYELFFLVLTTYCGPCSSGIEVSDCGRYVLLYISKGAEPRNKLLYCDLEKLEGRRITGEWCYCVVCVLQLRSG